MIRNHFYACLLLCVLSIPVFFIDHYYLSSGTGGWISLDFHDVLIKAYLFFLAVHLVISSVSLRFLPPSSTLFNQARSLLFSGILIGVGISLAFFISDYAGEREKQNTMEARRAWKDLIEIEKWWYVFEGSHVKEVHVHVLVKKAGRFAGDFVAYEGTEAVFSTVLRSMETPQRQVKEGDRFVYIFPIEQIADAPATITRITFYLFRNDSGGSAEDIKKVYQSSSISTEDDGEYFYEKLPAPDRIK